MIHNEQEWQTAEEAIEWVHSLLTLGIKPGLKRMEWMLERLGHPERRLKFIHVGGTNGKGSTVSFIRNVLQEAGYDVGSFTSPYIERFHNRIQLNGQDIPDEDLLKVTKQIKPLADELATTELGAPTEFEVVTMMAILYYARVSYPDYVLWEVGLGGRLDSTNVVVSILSIITNVGFDHIHILGDRIEDIAYEKAGIIKSGVPIVTGSTHVSALQVIIDRAKELKAAIYPIHQAFHIQSDEYNEKEQIFSYQSVFAEFNRLAITMKGPHQIENAALAIQALEVLKQYYAILWDEEHLREGLRKTQWMGRFEIIRQRPLTILEGAHNPEGIQALRKTIQQYYGDRPITVLFSAMKDKKIVDMLSYLNGVIDQLVLTHFNFPRAATVPEMMDQMSQMNQLEPAWDMAIKGEENWYKAYQELLQTAQEEEVILITGSLYFISEVRQTLKN